MAKLPLLSLCALLPLAAAAAFHPSAMFAGMGGEEVRDAVAGILGLCPAAAACFEGPMRAAFEKRRERFERFEREHPMNWTWVYHDDGTVTEPEGYKEYVEFEVENKWHDVADVCAALTTAQDECASKCKVDKAGVYGTLGQPIIDFVCKERLDEVKSTMMCARRMASPLVAGVDWFGRCGRPRRLAQSWLDDVQEAVRGGERLSALADKVIGANGAAARLCKENACYTEHFQGLIEKHCGTKTTLIADFQSMVTPHVLKIIDGMHIGCLVPDACKGTLPVAALFALIEDL